MSPAQDDTIDITYDPCTVVVDAGSASNERSAAIDDALEMWNSDAGTRLKTSTDATLPHVEIRFQKAAGAFHGLYDDERGIVFINSQLEGRPLAITIAHELGHAFGLQHRSAAEPSVMIPNNLTISPNPGDALRLQALWGTCEPASADRNDE